MPLNILISSLPLPATKVGSWTNRIGEFQKQTNFFDHILSPTENPDSTFIFCQKRDLNPIQKLSGNRSEKVGTDYFLELLKLGAGKNPLKILVVDDRSLLEAIALRKEELPKGTELYYSHHGHQLGAPPHIFDLVDKVFFLTELGYQKTLEVNYQFTPEVFVIGNGVVGDGFKPISQEEKNERRKEFGWTNDDIVITWLANARPVKGLHLFKKVVANLLEKYSNLKVLSIGHKPQSDLNSSNWVQVGQVSNSDLPKYLQLGDAYFFTSVWQEGFGLSLAEAVKCGNIPITSPLGGITEVLSEVPHKIYVQRPNIVEDWVNAFEEYLNLRNSPEFISQEFDFGSWQSYDKWEQRFLNALKS
ncbi:glycosyltransferase family 4 protein [Algoriphagus sediminis]|uniref:Glycosyltransferase family 4 protein n=1 Tax=Algoriphagus sediminis TaxID=3057113 RepID=A0ABT7YE36_9BACT|nr:glycosyltransferase family 4 protein [Algoriphagus sediminis]MDN3204747.1 glycosyltransferase family 4 protein [Algoriphagus sediminis]